MSIDGRGVGSITDVTQSTPALDFSTFDPDVRVQDDLYRHVNGLWIDRTEIPSDKARYGSFHVLQEEAEKAVRDIIVEAQQADPGTEERKVGDLFASFMDEERIEALGWEPLRAELASVALLTDIPTFLHGLGAFERTGVGGFLGDRNIGTAGHDQFPGGNVVRRRRRQ